MKLLWLIDSLTMGGAESLTVAFAQAARARGIDLTVCARTSIDGNPLEAEVRDARVRVESLGARNLRDLRAFRRLLALARGADVIHTHLTYAAIWGALASRLTRVPMVATLHVPPSRGTWRDRVRHWLLVFLLNRYARHVVLVSHSLRQQWPQLKNVTVIHNGIWSAAAMPPLSKRQLRCRTPKVLTVSVLREGKGIETLLQAAIEVDAEFQIAGGGPLRYERAPSNVHFLGTRRDIPQLMEEATLFVHPALADAFPTVLLEAMSAGLPIIASNVGGIPEIINEKLVTPGDPAALAAAIREALSDSDWRDRAGRANRERFEQHFTIERWLDRLEALYREIR